MQPTAELMAIVNARLCQYRCGECSYDERAQWNDHQQHYEQHRLETP
jgi:hypothetical protein